MGHRVSQLFALVLVALIATFFSSTIVTKAQNTLPKFTVEIQWGNQDGNPHTDILYTAGGENTQLYRQGSFYQGGFIRNWINLDPTHEDWFNGTPGASSQLRTLFLGRSDSGNAFLIARWNAWQCAEGPIMTFSTANTSPTSDRSKIAWASAFNRTDQTLFVSQDEGTSWSKFLPGETVYVEFASVGDLRVSTEPQYWGECASISWYADR